MVLNFKRIGQRIRVIRKAQQLTQAELAEMLSGCTASEQQFLLGVLSAIKDFVRIFGSTINQ